MPVDSLLTIQPFLSSASNQLGNGILVLKIDFVFIYFLETKDTGLESVGDQRGVLVRVKIPQAFAPPSFLPPAQRCPSPLPQTKISQAVNLGKGEFMASRFA